MCDVKFLILLSILKEDRGEFIRCLLDPLGPKDHFGIQISSGWTVDVFVLKLDLDLLHLVGSH